jgi:hypothetical protein
MTAYTVTDDVLKTPAAQDYFCRADRRVLIGLRAALELLGIPLPDYAVRKPPGVPPVRAIAAAYDADQGITRKPAAPGSWPEHRKAAYVRNAFDKQDRKRAAQGLPPIDRSNLFHDVFED